MELSDEQIAKFQSLYKKHFGVELSAKNALEQGLKLLAIMSVIYKPFTEKQLLNHKIRCEKHQN